MKIEIHGKDAQTIDKNQHHIFNQLNKHLNPKPIYSNKKLFLMDIV